MKSNENQIDHALENVNEDKRDFIRKIVVGTAFSLPFLVSYSMNKFRLGPPDAYASP